MVIATTAKPKGPSLPSKRPFGIIYELAKEALQAYGYYEEFKQYDPGYYYETYVEKYKYAPRKRIAGYLGQKLHEKKPEKQSGFSYQFQQKRGQQLYSRDSWNKNKYPHCRCTRFRRPLRSRRRRTWMRY